MNRVKSTQDLELKERLVAVNRVTKVTKGGRTFTFAAIVVVGNEAGIVGWGLGKAGEVTAAIAKGVESAKKNLVKVPVINGTVPHEATAHFGGAEVLIMPASAGTGVVAGGAKSWYDMGELNMQPTEFVKIILIIYLAVYYHRFGSKKDVSLWKMSFPLIVAVSVFILVAMQPDFGGAFIIAVITALRFFSLPVAKKQKRTIYKVGVGTVFVAIFAVLFLGKEIFHSYQVSRLLNFNFSNSIG